MKQKSFIIGTIPALLIGEKSENIYLFIHGQGGNKEEALAFAEIANPRGWQVLSVDLPEHGERKNMKNSFFPWVAVPELKLVMKYSKENWKHISLRANSIGAWFSMQAFADDAIEKALFVSPMVNMEKLITDMMTWAAVTEEELKDKGEIETSFGQTLSWKYLTYAKENQLTWHTKTSVPYAGKDYLVSRETMNEFIKTYHADLTVMETGEHWFHTKEQLEVLQKWENRQL